MSGPETKVVRSPVNPPGDDLIERASQVMPQVALESARLLRLLA
jgi:hypothetical protein